MNFITIFLIIAIAQAQAKDAVNAAKDPQLTVLSNFGDHEHQVNY
uniref:Uncharacterized protein n=1 Tax=Phlebotomus papatasi TaxID=29031 RepID=A0A1B0D6G7_PHLPP